MRTLLSASCLLLAAAFVRAEGPPTIRAASNRGAPQVPDDFGTGRINILQIPASAFTPRCSGVTTSYMGNGYTGVATDNGCSGPNGQLQAPVDLPTGARIFFLDLYAQDDEAGMGDDLTALLRGYTGGFDNDDSFVDVVGVSSASVTGRQYAASNLVNYTVNNDVAYGAGAALNVLVYVEAGIAVGFRGVDIWWTRQVSPAPANATFNDVPTNHPFFQFIEALSKSGITGGCSAGPPLYCPDNPVTRGQMAVFLSKALGLSWYDAAGIALRE